MIATQHGELVIDEYADFADLATVGAYGHGGASGCQLVIDPAANAVVAVLTNTYARIGREQWYMRLQALLNCAFATLA